MACVTRRTTAAAPSRKPQRGQDEPERRQQDHHARDRDSWSYHGCFLILKALPGGATRSGAPPNPPNRRRNPSLVAVQSPNGVPGIEFQVGRDADPAGDPLRVTFHGIRELPASNGRVGTARREPAPSRLNANERTAPPCDSGRPIGSPVWHTRAGPLRLVRRSRPSSLRAETPGNRPVSRGRAVRRSVDLWPIPRVARSRRRRPSRRPRRRAGTQPCEISPGSVRSRAARPSDVPDADLAVSTAR